MKGFQPDPLEKALKAELGAGEHLRWHGRANMGVANLAAFGIWLFAIPWTGFALFWTFMAWHGVNESGEMGLMRYAFPAFGIPFILIGLGMLAAPFLGLFTNREIIHGVTNRRLITLIKVGKSLKVKSLQAHQIGPVTRWEGKAGRGKISIETHTSRDSEGSRRTETVDLIGIDEVRRVGELVRDLSRSADEKASLAR
ncbi:PH domain-containing protein [Sphingomicrobium lutaoense]|uniref:DUF304 domain-containing protein n=1 Tax=Sphingomicrobium lutaoense TaxID=515949 RepID=A0A839Z1G1_9SPHN|nr:hypothetical protein [Sphingomicrobium lutaoense]MBB3764510.1 hypothetical protein [Sphingomicrobium lutaoense]